ncbi:MAG TPA: YidC/Oxa1 family membrane protein insertase [Acidimicrobiia bacterium]|nr:YidC/Oxa1 family membrane protein insertase [Acidimicrobiia bacterium]
MLAGSVLDPLYHIVGWLLAFLYYPTHNLGLAIIVLTLFVMFIQLPLIAKQTRSMILMQRVQPEIKKIQQKYKDDRAKQNEELMKYYQENKINPLAGCLPLLLIMPIGIAVLGTFRHPGIQYHIPRNGTFSKLYVDMCGKLDPAACSTKIKTTPPGALNFLGMHLNLSAANAAKEGVTTALPYFLLLALVILSGWYQVRQTQARQLKSGGAAPNAQMQAVTKIMPLFFGVISYGFSAATTIYFVISNLWRIGQQHFVLNKMYEEEHAKPIGSSAATATGTVEVNPPDTGGSANGAPGPSPNAARRKKKKRKR